MCASDILSTHGSLLIRQSGRVVMMTGTTLAGSKSNKSLKKKPLVRTAVLARAHKAGHNSVSPRTDQKVLQVEHRDSNDEP